MTLPICIPGHLGRELDLTWQIALSARASLDRAEGGIIEIAIRTLGPERMIQYVECIDTDL